MKLTTPDNAEKVPFNLEGRKMYVNPKAEIIHLTLKSGEVVDIHTNPFDVVFYTLEGTATLNVDGKEYNLPKDCTLEIPKDIPRGMKNKTEDILRVLVFKVF